MDEGVIEWRQVGEHKLVCSDGRELEVVDGNLVQTEPPNAKGERYQVTARNSHPLAGLQRFYQLRKMLLDS